MAVTITKNELTEPSYNLTGNTSQVRYVVQVTTTGGTYNNYTQTGTFYINGVKYTNTYKLPKTSTTTVFDKTVTITHGSDGKKTVTASCSVPTVDPYGTLTGETSRVLTTIPRQSSLTSVTVDIANNGTTKITPKGTKYVSSYYDILTVKYGSKELKFNGVTMGTAITLTSAQLTELWAMFGTNTQITLSCSIQTKASSSGDVIGTSNSVSTTAKLPNYGISFDYSIQDSETSYNIFKPSNDIVMIANLSKPKITFNATSTTGQLYGRTITYKINNSNVNSPYTMPSLTSNTLNITATDGRISKITNVLDGVTIIPYQLPIIEDFNIVRSSPTSSEATVTVKLKYYDGNGLQNLKALAFTFTYTQAGSSAVSKTISAFTKGTPTTTNHITTVTYTYKITGLDYQKSVNYGISGTDLLGKSFSKTNLTLQQGVPLYNGFMYNNEQYMKVNGNLLLQNNNVITGVKTATSLTDTNWSSVSQRTYVPNMAFMAYWNGAYNDSGTSNLRRCSRGAIVGSSDIAADNFYSKVTFASGETPAHAMFVKSGKVVTISFQGASKAHAADALLFTLPEAYRPTGSDYLYIPFVKNTTSFGIIQINCSNGQVVVNQIGNTTTVGRIIFTASYIVA